MPNDFRQVAACVEISIKAQDTATQSEMFNVIHALTGSTEPTGGDVTAAADAVVAWCAGVYNQNFSSQIQIVEIRAKSLFASVAPFDNRSVSNTGTQNDYDELDHAPLILLHGSLSSRNQAGKFYGFPPQANLVTQQGYASIYYVNMLAAITNLKSQFSTRGLQLAVASKDTGIAYRVTSVGHSNRLTIQKRRRIGFGR